MKTNRILRSNVKNAKSILSLRKPQRNKRVKKKKRKPICRKKLTKTSSNSPFEKSYENVSICSIYAYINV
jgi:hypothetical protein